MTLLTALNDVQRLCSLPVTTTIVADGQETQNLLYTLARRSALDLARRHDWPALKREHSFTASLAELQASGKPSDFDRLIKGSMWNRTADRNILGPLTSEQWQLFKGRPITVTIDRVWMLRYDGLHLYPAPTAADTIAYEYVTNKPVLAVDGVTYKTNFTLDSDSFVLSEEMLILDVIWRYFKQKGLDYAEQMRDAELRIASEINANEGIVDSYIAVQEVGLSEGYIPEGSWPGS